MPIRFMPIRFFSLTLFLFIFFYFLSSLLGGVACVVFHVVVLAAKVVSNVPLVANVNRALVVANVVQVHVLLVKVFAKWHVPLVTVVALQSLILNLNILLRINQFLNH